MTSARVVSVGLCVCVSLSPALARAAFQDFDTTPTLVKSGVEVTTTFQSTTTLAAPPTVTLGGAAMSLMGEVAGIYTFTYIADGSEGDGWKDVVAAGVDLLSNDIVGSQPSACRFDFTAPEILDLSATPSLVKAGDTVVVTFYTVEAVQGTPLVTLGASAMTFMGLAAGTYTFTYTVDGSESEGFQDVLVALVDLAGNPGVATQSDAVVFDFSPPDADADGEPDATDCAPQDPAYQGTSGVACDADSDGYCDASITGSVRESDCPSDVCDGGWCVPGDCDDDDGGVNPGVAETAFGDPICDNGADDDCDGAADGDDSGCWECSVSDDCDDGNVCNGVETCVSGFCAPGSALDCDDGNVCTDPVCNPTSGCEPGAPNQVPCDDGDPCTTGDQCTAGSCVGGDAPDGDGDGFADPACGGTDCDDGRMDVHPDAAEICDDGVDNDCNGALDAEDPVCTEDHGPSPVEDGCSCGAGPSGAGPLAMLVLGWGARRRRRKLV